MVIFDGAGNQTIATGGTGAGRAFNHFTIDKTGGSATLSADLEINGNFSVSSGTFNSTTRNLLVGGSWTNSGSWTQSGGRVTFDATNGGPYSIASTGSGAFQHITLNAAGITYRLGSNLDINGDLILSAGTLQNQGNDIYLAGAWTNNATFTAAGGSVIFDGTGNQDINSGGTSAGKIFPNFICDKTGGDLKINAAIKLNGNLIVSNGIFDMNGRNLNLTGNFINNGAIGNPATLTFDGTSGGPYSIYSGASTLNIITINAVGVTYQLSGTTRLNGNLNITSGEFHLNGRQFYFGNGADVISISGTLEVDAGAILAMANGSTLTVNSGGTVRLVGESGNRATITEQSASGSYSFSVGSGGIIHARQALLEYMGSNGINIQDGATIDITNNFSHVTFDNGQAGGTLFRVGNITGSNQLVEISGASFPTNPGGNAYNVTKTLSSDTLKFTSASGAFAGEAFDNDPAEPTGNLIQWGTIRNLRIWTGDTSTNWHTATNWSPLGVPADSEDVEIGAASNNPIIGIENAAARNITLFNGGILLLQNGFDLDINGDFVNGNGNLIVTSSNSTITTAGHWNNAGSFSHGNSLVTLSGISKQLLDGGGTGNNKAFNNLVIVNPDSVQLSGSLDVNGNLLLSAGVLHVNGQRFEFGDAAADVITISGTLHLNDSSILQMTAHSRIIVNSAGTLKVLGSSTATRPRITRLNSGNYTIEVYSGGTIDVSQAWIEYTGGSGINVSDGANIHSTSKFDNVVFQNGTGSAYLTIENSQNLTMSGVRFDSAAVGRPAFNVNYSGTGSIDFSDYMGSMSGVNFENDNGSGIRGNVRWYFTQTEAVNSSVTFGNDLVVTAAGSLGNVTVVLVDQTLPLVADSSVARYYTVEPSNGGMASIRLYYGDGELQSEVEQDLLIWRRRNGQWTMMGGNIYTSRNYIEIPGFNYDFFAGVKDTLILSDATDDTSLPVELVLFEAIVAGKNIVLQWQTASEIGNARWYIERKILSRQEYHQIEAGELLLQNTAQDFIRIAGIEGQGSVSTLTEYEYVDENISLEFVYAYRLIDVSFSGEMTWHSPLMVVPPAVPGKFVLVQNYPNPFNPETTIKFNLPVNARISLRIYNILGQRIITLEDGEMPAGAYEVKWDGTNQNRQLVASGTYIYQISAKSTEEQQIFTQSKRMIVMR